MCYKCQQTIKTFYVLTYIITAVRSVDMKKWDRCINGKVKLNKTGTKASDLKSLYTVFKIMIYKKTFSCFYKLFKKNY